jgi:hypothetical protein
MLHWDNTPLFVKFNQGILNLLVLLDETSLQTGISVFFEVLLLILLLLLIEVF